MENERRIIVVRFSDNGNSNWSTTTKKYSDFIEEYINEFKVVKTEDLHFFVTSTPFSLKPIELLELNEYVCVIHYYD